MAIEIEVLNGDASRQSVAPLLDAVWNQVQRNAAWRTIEWADPDLRIVLEADGRIASHIGLYFRNVTWNGRSMHIGGVGGVSTHPDDRRKGYASVALNAAAQTLRDRQDAQFGLLFCEPHDEAFYRARGWHSFSGDVFVQQRAGRVLFDALAPMVLDLKRAPRQGTIDLCGLPW